MVWWHSKPETIINMLCALAIPLLMLTHTQASKGALGSPPLAIGLAITTCHLFAVNIAIVILVVSLN